MEASAKLGGDGLAPFYTLIEGGRDGELLSELEEFFYYAQMKKYMFIKAFILIILYNIIYKSYAENFSNDDGTLNDLNLL